jgi:TorA-specific chaperone
MSDPLSVPVFLFGCTDLLASVFRGPSGSEYTDLARNGLPEFETRCPAELTEMRPIFCSMARRLDLLAGQNKLDDLEAEFVRLFITNARGVPAPLYHSCHDETGSGQVLGPAALTMQDRLTSAGLETASPGEPPDHLCLELEYLHFLQALTLTRPDSAPESPTEFARNHVLPWAGRLRRKIEVHSREPFFPLAGRLLCLVLEKI